MSEHTTENCAHCHGEGIVTKPVVKTRSGGGGDTCAFCSHENCDITHNFKIWNWKMASYFHYKLCECCHDGCMKCDNHNNK